MLVSLLGIKVRETTQVIKDATLHGCKHYAASKLKIVLQDIDAA
jgi:hypothetical protein